jgi:hypothetical protein
MADQHQAYVDHLNAALVDDGVRNIALTGRYGTGKSSVLEEFARQNRKRVLFLSLSTLGPEKPGESRTNQIEKNWSNSSFTGRSQPDFRNPGISASTASLCAELSPSRPPA